MKLLRAGLPPEEIPGEVAKRFDWTSVLDDVEAYAEAKRVDAGDLKRALSTRTRRRAPRARTRSGQHAIGSEVTDLAKRLGVSPSKLTDALKKTAKKR